jgi:hypothetical protein
MAINLDHIGVTNLGPILKFDQKFKRINLIYGQNERGKTYLVEFIYRSLFKNLCINTRPSKATGQIFVDGLEKQSVIFSPSIKEKLEDYWVDSIPGLPRDFSKLLVVKGADLDFISLNPAGLDNAILKEFLSGEGILEKIEKKLGKTEITATFSEGRITGPRKGEIQKYNERKAKIEQIDALFQKINQNYSEGPRYQIKQEIDRLDDTILEQENAKRYLAYSIDKKLQTLKTERELLPDLVLNEADKLFTRYTQNKDDLAKKDDELEIIEENTKHYPWINCSVDEYQKLLNQTSSKKIRSGIVWMAATLSFMVLSIVLIFLHQPYISMATIILAAISGVFYVKQLRNKFSNEIQIDEINRIEKEYENRFGEKLTGGIATLIFKKNEIQPKYFSIDPLKKDIDELKSELMKDQLAISLCFKQLSTPLPDAIKWENEIIKLREKNKALDDQIQSNNVEFAKLGIASEDFIEKPGSASYDHNILVNSTRILEEKKNDLKEFDNALQQVKHSVCQITGTEINCQWEELIVMLQNERSEAVKQYKDYAASIIAQVKLNEALEELRNIESERIEQGLSSEVVQQAIKTTTGHYSRIEKKENEIFVSDQYGSYEVGELSTGAREQVLLGLRIGFAARILAGQPLFLILDDAFQHSDWERRENLINELFVLAHEGWQIIYFTMDDNIRSLFEKRSEKIEKDLYQTIVLKNDFALN